MADLSDNEVAVSLAEFLNQEKAGNVRVLDVSAFCDWTHYVVLATVQSRRQLQGVIESLEDFLAEHKKERLNKRPALESDWVVWDCGDLIIHLFLPQTRSFYDLDRLYHDAKVIREFS